MYTLDSIFIFCVCNSILLFSINVRTNTYPKLNVNTERHCAISSDQYLIISCIADGLKDETSDDRNALKKCAEG